MNSCSTMLRPIAALLTGLALAASAQAQGVLDTKKGQGGSEVQGAAGTQGAQGAAGDLERCDKPMGAVAVVVESEASCKERGVVPLGSQLAAITVNSAYHGTRLDVEHIASVMRRVVDDVCAAEGITPAEMARDAFFMSHETYTPARGGSAAAEIEASKAFTRLSS